MSKIDQILNVNERIIWQGKPKFWPYLLNITVVVWLIVTVVLPLYVWSQSFALMAALFAVVMGFVLSGVVMLTIWEYHNTAYFLTDKRVIVQHGVIGLDYLINDYDRITHLALNVGFIDKIFNSGTVAIRIAVKPGPFGMITTGSTFAHIDKHVEVYTMLKKVSYDVKSDIEFPNALRADENKGYDTVYQPDPTAIPVRPAKYRIEVPEEYRNVSE